MKRIIANLKKTIYYLKRNGLKNTWYAVWERLSEQKKKPYNYIPPTEMEKAQQKKEQENYSVTFSIVVPAYKTKEVYLKELVESLQKQTYPKWQLILADATEDESVKSIIDTFNENRIFYVHLAENGGISENTNQALSYVTGDYTGLLDHDDILTEDALFEMAAVIEKGKKCGVERKLLYSDEDKCNGDRTKYYEPNRKENFNLDLLLSNNYICHFLVMESKLIKQLRLRKEYEGAQDYDLVLRAVECLQENRNQIVHIPKVLYHWRCHTDSTAENPQSKQYAYEAGRRALQNYADQKNWNAKAVHLKHLGFYALQYQQPILEVRSDVGAVGGRLLKKGKIAGGRISKKGKIYYKGLPASYSGYLHRAILSQNAEAIDIRFIQVREECRELFEQIVGVPYVTKAGEDFFDADTLPNGIDYIKVSLELGQAIRKAGYYLLWLPTFSKKI